ncbi:mycofactocin system transcriptional regulator [Nocardioides mangrovicus]|uniref:Mycofactocin system transcriptional regulator n=1 Tax=Nocardioides mangrovicus TaxID=2478913 RepID=A0A3L8NXH8_9ACTN|nr:mycofactocin system transcriptional regulator [Nocardioides mangrovicus]RLV47541.1 mycofactocin system transcriptional regulator [Nocardioides mangrovicus]
MSSQRRQPGRPEATSHGEIEQAAFALFAERGFDGTTLDDIADAVGVGRRTLFRYFRSKNDIPWGQFDLTLDAFRRLLASMPEDLPLHESVHRGVMDFNDFPDDAMPAHRERMRLILTNPALQAHSMLRYAEWRDVIAEHVAWRTRGSVTDLLPRTVGHVSLALALTAYDVWLADEHAVLLEVLEESMGTLRSYLGPS